MGIPSGYSGGVRPEQEANKTRVVPINSGWPLCPGSDSSRLIDPPRVAHRRKHFAPECVLELSVVFVAFDLPFVCFLVVNLESVRMPRKTEGTGIRGLGLASWYGSVRDPGLN